MYPQVPTAKQTVEFLLVCVRLSNVLQPINIVRLYERTNQIYILAGDDIEVLIYPNAKVRFL
ncbi:DUF6888 family protein [Nostoc sp.]|uniref:DUF6888 family protein n=1 Tax=Nostoc sp. TaxID=1180 RepID=UPI003FA543FE